MDNILNREGIKNYSNRFASNIIEGFFSKGKVITGEEIKSLTEIKQVNLFIVKGLFEEWQKENDQLKSKFFNYQSDEVKKAMSTFMNVLSKNISVAKEDFEPLLLHAVEESILLIFSPFDFYVHLSEHYSGELSVANLKKVSRYIKVNKNIMEALISKLERANKNDVSIKQYSDMLNEVLHEIESGPEEIDSFFDSFNAIEPLSESDIYGETTSGTDEKEDTQNDLPQKPDEPKAEEVTIKQKDRPSINEVLASNGPSLAESLEKEQVDSIKSSLTINQRFMFQKALFNGDEDVMNKALGIIDDCQSKKEAMDYLFKEFPHWNIEAEEFEELVELIARKLD